MPDTIYYVAIHWTTHFSHPLSSHSELLKLLVSCSRTNDCYAAPNYRRRFGTSVTDTQEHIESPRFQCNKNSIEYSSTINKFKQARHIEQFALTENELNYIHRTRPCVRNRIIFAHRFCALLVKLGLLLSALAKFKYEYPNCAANECISRRTSYSKIFINYTKLYVAREMQ